MRPVATKEALTSFFPLGSGLRCPSRIGISLRIASPPKRTAWAGRTAREGRHTEDWDAQGYLQAVNVFSGLLNKLGTERKARPINDLNDYLQNKYGSASEPEKGLSSCESISVQEQS